MGEWGFDERREIHRLLRHLSAARRLEWLQWCCTLIPDKGFTHTKVVQSTGEVDDVFWDALSLTAMFDVSLVTMGERLAAMVKGQC